MFPDYKSLIDFVWTKGKLVAPRGLETKEIIGLSLQYDAGETITRKGFNTELAMAELQLMVNGTWDKQSLIDAAPHAEHELFNESGAYGPRVRHQLNRLIDALKSDTATRRAVLQVWRPQDDPMHEVPCTTSLQFLLREDILHLIVNMRSLDLVRGLPYDMLVFGGYLMWIGQLLEKQAGVVTIHTGSMHIYVEDIPLTVDAGEGNSFAYVGPELT